MIYKMQKLFLTSELGKYFYKIVYWSCNKIIVLNYQLPIFSQYCHKVSVIFNVIPYNTFSFLFLLSFLAWRILFLYLKIYWGKINVQITAQFNVYNLMSLGIGKQPWYHYHNQIPQNSKSFLVRLFFDGEKAQ